MALNFLSANWENLIMANYEVDPEVLLPFLPQGVELDLFGDKCYLSLVGFMFKGTSLFGIPIPLLGTFEEINLRFYVKRVEGNKIKRGVVFINETVPYKAVAWLANKLYREHYVAIPTKSLIKSSDFSKVVRYEWKINKRWNHLQVTAHKENRPMLEGSLEEFIYEHYYGYTKLSPQLSQEYRVNHPRWNVNTITDYSIHCDFDFMYGRNFLFLNESRPASVIIAEGSPVTVSWKRTRF